MLNDELLRIKLKIEYYKINFENLIEIGQEIRLLNNFIKNIGYVKWNLIPHGFYLNPNFINNTYNPSPKKMNDINIQVKYDYSTTVRLLVNHIHHIRKIRNDYKHRINKIKEILNKK